MIRPAARSSVSNFIHSVWHREREDLRLLLFSFAVTTLVWQLMVGFGSALFMSNDAMMFTPHVQELLRVGGDWRNFLYRANMLGGVVMADNIGKVQFYQWAAWLGMPAHLAQNFALIITQSLFAFFGARASLSLARCWRSTAPASGARARGHDVSMPDPRLEVVSPMAAIGLVLLFGFAPAVGARVQYGHLDLLLGLLLFLIAAANVIGAFARDNSRVLSLVSVLALVNCIVSHGHQTKLYSVVFGAPILLGILLPMWLENKGWSWGSRWRHGLIVIAVFAAGFLLALPRFIGMLNYASSTDASRSLSTGVIYSYFPLIWTQFLTSIPWFHQILNAQEGPLTIAEAIYPLGPLLLFCLLLANRRLHFLLGGWLFSLALAAILILKIEPLADAILSLLPTLKAFRVPARALLPLVLSAPLISAAAILLQWPSRASRLSYICLALGCLWLWLLPDWGRELSLWALVIGLIVMAKTRLNPSVINAGLILCLLGFGSLLAFSRWSQSHPDKVATLSELARMGSEIKQKSGYLPSSLARTYLGFQENNFQTNTALAMGFSSLSGYWNPTGRYLRLLSAAEERPFDATAVNFNMSPQMASAPLLGALYNICCRIDQRQDGAYSVNQIGQTLGVGWFSQEIGVRQSTEEIVRELKANSGQLNNFLQQKMLVDNWDEKRVGLIFNNDKQIHNCLEARLLSMTELPDHQSFRLQVQTPGNCPLTLALNYSELLEARDSEPSLQSRSFQVVPAYGALTGIIVPAGTRSFVLRAVPYEPRWTHLAWSAGLALLLVLMIWHANQWPVSSPNTAAAPSTENNEARPKAKPGKTKKAKRQKIQK